MRDTLRNESMNGEDAFKVFDIDHDDKIGASDLTQAFSLMRLAVS
jgi:Ca2+-binding EF-hand superfamily protein